jgi:hypothetical protein
MDTKTAGIVKKLVLTIGVVALGYVVKYKIATTHEMVWVAAGWLFGLYFAVRIGLAFKRAHANFRAHTAGGINLTSIDKLTTAAMEPWMRGHYLIEKRCYRGFWHTLRGKPLAPGRQFTVAGGPNSARLSAAMLLAVLAAAASGTLFVPGGAAFWPRLSAFGAIAATALYAAVWIVGARRNLKEGGHTLACGTLTLELGIRCSGVLAIGSIAACTAIGGDFAAVRAQRKIAAGELWTLSPGERVNVLIELKEATALQTVAFGSAREISRKFVALYVDGPDLFAAAVADAMAEAGAENNA